VEAKREKEKGEKRKKRKKSRRNIAKLVSSPPKGQMSVGGLKGLGQQVHRGVSSDQVNGEVGREREKKG